MHRLLLGLALLSGCLAGLPLKFEFKPAKQMLMGTKEEWEVGQSNRLALSDAKTPVMFSVRVRNGRCQSLKRLLRIRCPQSDVYEKDADLDSDRTFDASNVHCSSTHGFIVKRADERRFQLIMKASVLNGTLAFSENIELRVRVSCEGETLDSPSLSVWNLQPLLDVNSEVRKLEFDDETRYYKTDLLSSKGMYNLFALLKKDSGNYYFHRKLLDPVVVSAINKAPVVFKHRILVGVLMGFDIANCTMIGSAAKVLPVVNYANFFNKNQTADLNNAWVDVETGEMRYTDAFVFEAKKMWHNSQKFVLCSMLSIASEYDPYTSIRLTAYLPVKDLYYDEMEFPLLNEICLWTSSGNLSMNFFSGVSQTPFIPPFVCHGPYWYVSKYNGSELLYTGSEDWKRFPNNMKLHASWKLFMLPVELTSSLAGKYTFRMSFPDKVEYPSDDKYNVTLSVTVAPRIRRRLPPFVYAVEGEAADFRCEFEVANLKKPDVEAEFRLWIDGVWTTLNKTAFDKHVGNNNFMTVNSSKTPQLLQLNFSLTNVPLVARGDPLVAPTTLLCRATLEPENARQLGIEWFQETTASDLVYIGRPKSRDFVASAVTNCSEQACDFAAGGRYEVSVRRLLADALRSARVKLVGYFQLNADSRRLQSRLLVNWSFHEANATLELVVQPVTDNETLEELQAASVRPVFKLAYADDVTMETLVMRKAAPASNDTNDCLRDKRCFYSTEYDFELMPNVTLDSVFREPVDKSAQSDKSGAAGLSPATVALAAALVVALVVTLAVGHDRDG